MHDEELVPKNLKLELEPTVGSYDQESVDKMEDIVAHCGKTIVKAESNIKETEPRLKNLTETEEYKSIEKTIKINEANTKRLLLQRKFKKFNTNQIQQQRKYHNQP